MRGNKIARALKFLVIGVIAAAVFGFVVMHLWNWLMPSVFGLHAVSYWQALALLVLARLLFGGFRRGPGRFGPGMQWRERMMERWTQMTPEEREKFITGMGAGMGRSCGPFATPAPSSKP